jgi:hypothetical protein
MAYWCHPYNCLFHPVETHFYSYKFTRVIVLLSSHVGNTIQTCMTYCIDLYNPHLWSIPHVRPVFLSFILSSRHCWRGILYKFQDLHQKEVKYQKEIKIWTRVCYKADAKERKKWCVSDQHVKGEKWL